MKKKLRIGEDGFALPAGETVTSTIVVYGGKGMGKTNFGSVLAEELDEAGLRWSFLDPLGVNFGIRHSADGRGKGIECLILGGTRGDIPIEPDGGAAVADVVIEEHVNTMIDFSRTPAGKMWGVGEKIRFCTAYARRLFERQGELVKGRRREPLMQLLDEAARYIPQNIPKNSPQMSDCVSAWQQFVEEGRNIALGCCLLTQRSARLNKDVAELADAMVAFRTVGPNSLGAVLDWLGENVERERIKELSGQVRSLPRGSALVVSPGWLGIERVVAMRKRHTFDSSATPKPGERGRVAKGAGAKPDIEKIRARMMATIERFKQEDPKELKRRIAELEKQLAKGKPAPAAAAAAPAPVPSIDTKAVSAALARAARTVRGAQSALQKQHEAAEDGLAGALDELDKAGHALSAVQSRGRGNTRPGAALPARTTRAGITAAPKTSPRALGDASGLAAGVARRGGNGASPTPADDGSLPKGERIVLTAIAQSEPDGIDRDDLTLVCGYKRSTRNLYLQGLLRRAAITEDKSGTLRVTDTGLELIPNYEPLPMGDELREHWLAEGRLPAGEQRVLAEAVKHYPDTVSRDVIGEAAGYKRSTRNLYVQHLLARKLLVAEGKGQVQASPRLFD